MILEKLSYIFEGVIIDTNNIDDDDNKDIWYNHVEPCNFRATSGNTNMVCL